MNEYKILAFSCGQAREIVIHAYDPIEAIQKAGIMPNEVIRVELIGSMIKG